MSLSSLVSLCDLELQFSSLSKFLNTVSSVRKETDQSETERQTDVQTDK